MARRTHVPKFGNWDANDHMPYTAVFDSARHGRGKAINPNDPSENPDIFTGTKGNGGAPGRRIINPNDPEETDAPDLHQDRPGQGNRDTGNSRGQPLKTGQEPPARRQGSYPEGRSSAMPNRLQPTDQHRRPGSRDSIGTDRHTDSPSASFSADHSPSHPINNPVKKSTAGMMGGGSPAWDTSRRKSTGEEALSFAPATPTRSRLRTGNAKQEDSSQKGAAALPKFGAWNAQDPGSGDGFTVIFNNARNERKAGGPGRTPQANENSHDGDLYHQPNVLKSRDVHRRWFCCFSPVVNA